RCSLLFEIMVLSRTRHRALRRPAVIGFETNVIVRCPVQDDPKQSAAAIRLFERSLLADSPGYITGVTLCEVAWVLTECYGAGRARIKDVLDGLLASRQLAIEAPESEPGPIFSGGQRVGGKGDERHSDKLLDYVPSLKRLH
ncbi:MAG: hypothetical protein OEZ08_17895, partial [Betaproteobacteria bacterium]|nr:hypothetical protein [Betaproteobacteria bacterium]